MGKLVVLLKYVLFVFSSDINENRRHIHVTDKRRDLERICKFWIEPHIEAAYNIGFSAKEMNEIERLIRKNSKTINAQLDLFHQGKTVKSILKNE